MAMKLTDDDGNSTTTPSFYTLLHDQDFDVGTLSDLKLRNDITMDMNRKALIDRENEKMKIKEEFLTYGHLKHRRKLEEEALNELMMSQPSLHGLTSNWLDYHVLDGRLPLGYRSYDNVTDDLPFQRHPGFTSGVACKPVIDLRKTVMPQQPKTATSDNTLAGSKRKFEMPTIEIASNSKNTEIGWNCELCQVNMNSEQMLKNHLNGKKHKSKEKTVPKIHNYQRNIGFGNEHVKILNASSPEQQHSESNDGSGDGKQETQECSKKIDTDFLFWCTMCEVGTTDEASMEAHRIGEKHMRLLKEKGTLETTMQDDLHLSSNDTAINVLGAEAIEEKEIRDLCTMEAH